MPKRLTMDWMQYEGKAVSVLITGKGNKEENYVGTVVGIIDGFMIIDTENSNVTIYQIAFKTNLIRSIWLYKPKDDGKRKVALRDRFALGYPKSIK